MTLVALAALLARLTRGKQQIAFRLSIAVGLFALGALCVQSLALNRDAIHIARNFYGVLQISPPRERALKGTYLEHAVHRLGSASTPFVYANFVSSLDDRIALAQGGTSHVPKELTSASDFRLFLGARRKACRRSRRS
jgi:hypothetical protein